MLTLMSLRKMQTLSKISAGGIVDNIQDPSRTKNNHCISHNSDKYENIVDLNRNISCNGNIFFMSSKLASVLMLISCNIFRISSCLPATGGDVILVSIDEATGVSGIISPFPSAYNWNRLLMETNLRRLRFQAGYNRPLGFWGFAVFKLYFFLH